MSGAVPDNKCTTRLGRQQDQERTAANTRSLVNYPPLRTSAGAMFHSCASARAASVNARFSAA
jgi:hypothetical protein